MTHLPVPYPLRPNQIPQSWLPTPHKTLNPLLSRRQQRTVLSHCLASRTSRAAPLAQTSYRSVTNHSTIGYLLTILIQRGQSSGSLGGGKLSI